jgi:uncharacterized membrane protein YedE/YeeE
MQIASTDVWHALAGGALIGAGSATLLLLNGRIAGISGILGNRVRAALGEQGWRIAFIVGLFLPAWLLGVRVTWLPPDPGWAVAAGLLVGMGTQLGSGCTSGHGVCGLANLSARSLLATLVFMPTATATVFVIRHGVAP